MNYIKGLLLLFVSIQLVYGKRGRIDRGIGGPVVEGRRDGLKSQLSFAERMRHKVDSIRSNCDHLKDTSNNETTKILVAACYAGCNFGFDSDSSRCHEACSSTSDQKTNDKTYKVCMTACGNCKFKIENPAPIENPVPIETQSGVQAYDKPSNPVGVAPIIEINSLPDEKGTEESSVETNDESSEESSEESSGESSEETITDEMATLYVDPPPNQDQQNVDNNDMIVGDSSFTIQRLLDLFDLRGLFRIGLLVDVQDEDTDESTDTKVGDVSNDEIFNMKGVPFELPSIPVEEQFPFYRYRVCYPITFSFSTFCRDINNIFNCASIHSGLPRWFFVMIVLLSSLFMMWLGFFFLSMIKRMRKQPLFIDRTDGYLPLYKDIDFQIETRIEADPLPEKQKLESI